MINTPGFSDELLERIKSIRVNVAQQIPGYKDNFLFHCYYESDVDDFMDLLEEVGGIFLAVFKVPCWHKDGSRIEGSMDYVIIYQHIEELEMMIRC